MEGDYQQKVWRDAGGMVLGESMDKFGTCLWKEIWKDWAAILDNTKFFIGDGSRVSFWKDIWCGEEALCMAFPTLFSLVVPQL